MAAGQADDVGAAVVQDGIGQRQRHHLAELRAFQRHGQRVHDIAQPLAGDLPQDLERVGQQRGLELDVLVQLRRLDVLAHAERFVHRGPAVRRQVRQPQCPARARQRVVLVHVHAHRGRARIVRAQPYVVGRLEGQRDLRAFLHDAAHGFIGAGHVDAVGDVGMLAHERK
ncbi:hypothetical protein D3C87_1595130 [compost metagenome]